MKTATRNATAKKFWEIETRGCEQLVCTSKLGPFGRAPQYSCKYSVFADEQAAETKHREQVAAMEAKGFEPFERPSTPTRTSVDVDFASANDVFAALDMLADGFQFTASAQQKLASGGSADVLFRLAEAGVPLSPSCLTAAALTGESALVGRLLDRGIPVDSLGHLGMTPLMSAAQKGKDKVVEALLGAGADVDALDASGVSPLIHAAMSGSLRTVELILEKAPTVDVRTARGSSALTVAIAALQGASAKKRENARAVCQRLLDAGVSTTDDERAQLAQLDLLVSQGVEPIRRDESRRGDVVGGWRLATVHYPLTIGGGAPGPRTYERTDAELELEADGTFRLKRLAAGSQGRWEIHAQRVVARPEPEATALHLDLSGNGRELVLRCYDEEHGAPYLETYRRPS